MSFGEANRDTCTEVFDVTPRLLSVVRQKSKSERLDLLFDCIASFFDLENSQTSWGEEWRRRRDIGVQTKRQEEGTASYV